MHVRTMGRGPDVLLLHGIPSPAEHLVPLVRRLAENHRVILPDLPGYGPSDPPPDFSMATIRRLLEEELLRIGAAEPSVVGFSGGAFRAFHLAFSERVRVRRIVSLAGLAGFDREVGDAFRAYAEMFRSGVDMQDVVLGRTLSPGFAERNPDAVAEVRTWVGCAPARVIADELDGIARAADLRSELSGLRIPILARVGTLDQATPPSWTEEIAALAPNCALQKVEGCGHALLLEDAEATIAAVRSALAERA